MLEAGVIYHADVEMQGQKNLSTCVSHITATLGRRFCFAVMLLSAARTRSPIAVLTVLGAPGTHSTLLTLAEGRGGRLEVC